MNIDQRIKEIEDEIKELKKYIEDQLFYIRKSSHDKEELMQKTLISSGIVSPQEIVSQRWGIDFCRKKEANKATQYKKEIYREEELGSPTLVKIAVGVGLGFGLGFLIF